MNSFLRGVFRQLLYVLPILGLFVLVDRYADRQVEKFFQNNRSNPPQAPDFRLPRVDPLSPDLASAPMVGLSDLKNEPVILNFWASWCLSCRDEKPYLDAIWKRRKKYKNRMVGIATSDTWEQVVASGRATPEHFPTLLDANGEVAKAFGVDTLPQTIVLDPRGRILLRIAGPVRSPERVAELERMFSADVMDAYAL